MKLSIMHGRLSPPEDGRFQSFSRANWASEFERAAAAGLWGIEWIYDVYSYGANPIETDDGIVAMRELSRMHGIQVQSLCADWFMERLLFRVAAAEREGNQERLRWLLERCRRLGVRHIVLPFVDSSRLVNEPERAEIVQLLLRLEPEAKRCRVELHLETDLGPAQFAALLEQLPSPWIKANYDSGNSAANGFSASEEWKAYGSRIGSVHFKDRVCGGGTVPLGTGDVDWPELLDAMREFRGPLTMQVARGEDGQEISWARQNREWLENAARSHGWAG